MFTLAARTRDAASDARVAGTAAGARWPSGWAPAPFTQRELRGGDAFTLRVTPRARAVLRGLASDVVVASTASSGLEQLAAARSPRDRRIRAEGPHARRGREGRGARLPRPTPAPRAGRAHGPDRPWAPQRRAMTSAGSAQPERSWSRTPTSRPTRPRSCSSRSHDPVRRQRVPLHVRVRHGGPPGQDRRPDLRRRPRRRPARRPDRPRGLRDARQHRPGRRLGRDLDDDLRRHPGGRARDDPQDRLHRRRPRLLGRLLRGHQRDRQAVARHRAGRRPRLRDPDRPVRRGRARRRGRRRPGHDVRLRHATRPTSSCRSRSRSRTSSRSA